MKKIRVGVLFGGRSAEHEVSLQSARNVIAALDPEKYDVSLIGIDKTGRWHLNEGSSCLLDGEDPLRVRLQAGRTEVTPLPWDDSTQLRSLNQGEPRVQVDVVFPVLHGPMGEDGTVQGLLRLAGIPFVGSGVCGSAVAMDKDLSKRLLREAGLNVARARVLRSDRELDVPGIVNELGLPLFVKPANLGSSVGVHKVRSEEELQAAVIDAFRYDRKILVEEFIPGRELECSVLEDRQPGAPPLVSLPGEIVLQDDFYSYRAKYVDENGAILAMPAELDSKTTQALQETARKAFLALQCEGMARVDFFLTSAGKIYVNEINTIPGFTRISMYPKLWEISGIPVSELVDRLIQLALIRGDAEKRLETSLDLTKLE